MIIHEFQRKGKRVAAPIINYYLAFSLHHKKVMASIHTFQRARLISARIQVDAPGGLVLATGTAKGVTEVEAAQAAFAKAGIEAGVTNIERSLKELMDLIGYEGIIIINGAYQ